jgi:L-ascorbate metabolism protein UlaG (beta-lactamase superfamily)
MNTLIVLMLFVFLGLAGSSFAENMFESDMISTSPVKIEITFIGHGTLMIQCDKSVIHVDPVSQYADYSRLPKADLILVTHQHGDHLDKAAIDKIKKPDMDLVYTEICAKQVPGGIVMKNGDVKKIGGIEIAAVPAYNIVHKRPSGEPFHPKGEGNGYVLSVGGKRIYIAGDTENIPEMKNLKNIDIAFLPMNLPYTMTPQMVADAANMFHPRILYPYHYGDTNPQELVELMKDRKDCEVRIRKLK